jgi:hypothetical protein
MKLESGAFSNMQQIPAEYTSDGKDVSPPLSWSDVPPDAQSLVLIVDDPDAPDPQAPKRTWVHWVIYNLPAKNDELPEAARELPRGARVAQNDWKRADYGGPSPPIGRHRYFHKLYALDCVLADLGPSATKAKVEQEMQGHVLAQAELVGTYQKRAS